MAVFELKVEIPVPTVETVEYLLSEREQLSLMVLEDKPAGRAWITGYFDSEGAATAALAGFSVAVETNGWGEPVIRELPDEDWKESYKAHFKAWTFGRLHWVPIWERETFRCAPGEQVLWLDPGMAFGTGNHETTRLVVERMVAFANENGVGRAVLDAGCGSGILALSAAKLGFKQVAAFDNDPLAVEVSRENASLNNLTGAVEFFEGDLVSGLSGRGADLLLANIQADVLARFAPQLAAAMNPGGTLVLSGILTVELDRVRAVFESQPGLRFVSARALGEWSDLVLRR